MHPVIIEFGHLAIRWYGVMIALAFLVGMRLAGKEAERRGIGKERIQNFFSMHFWAPLSVPGYILWPLAM